MRHEPNHPIDVPFCPLLVALDLHVHGSRYVLAFACPLQPLQLVDGLIELAVEAGFVAQDPIQILIRRHSQRAFGRFGIEIGELVSAFWSEDASFMLEAASIWASAASPNSSRTPPLQSLCSARR